MAAGGTITSLTTNPVIAASDNGEWIAYEQDSTDPGNGTNYDQIVLVEVAGPTETVTGISAADVSDMSWGGVLTNDGAYLVVPVQKISGKRHIWRFNLSTGAGTQISSVVDTGASTFWAYQPDVANDENQIAYRADDPFIAPASGTWEDQILFEDSSASQIASRSQADVTGDAKSSRPRLAGDGDSVVFTSEATNLINGETLTGPMVYARDLDTDEVAVVSADRAGNYYQSDQYDDFVDVSDDGRFVVLLADGVVSVQDRDLDVDGVLGDDDGAVSLTPLSYLDQNYGDLFGAGISPNGRYVAYLTSPAYSGVCTSARVAATPTSSDFTVPVSMIVWDRITRLRVAEVVGDFTGTNCGSNPTVVAVQDDGDALYGGWPGVELVEPDWLNAYIPAAEALGGNYPSDPVAGDPVHAGTGNFTYAAEDLSLPGFGLSLSRSYNSADTFERPLGQGWSFNLDMAMVTADPAAIDTNKVVFHGPGGRLLIFEPTATAGQWVTPAGLQGELTRAAGEFVFTLGSGEVWTFDETTSILTSVQDGQGQAATIVRDAKGRLDTVTNETAQRQIAFSWPTVLPGTASATVKIDDGAGGWVTESQPRTVDYLLDDTGNLQRVNAPGGSAEKYTHDGRAITQIEMLTQASPEAWENVIINLYDTNGRVIEQQTPAGAENRFVYDDIAGETTVTTDPDGDPATQAGEESIIYKWNAAYEVTGIVDPGANSTAGTWDAGRQDTFTDRRGGDYVNLYDSKGRLKQRIWPDPATGDISPAAPTVPTESYTGIDEWFEYQDEATTDDTRVTSYTNKEGEETLYTYNGTDTVPATVTDPAGKDTNVVVVGGLISKSTDADGVVTDFFYGTDDDLDPSTPDDCPARMLCSQVADPGGVAAKTVYTYTDAGQVKTITRAYGTTAGGGSPGATTTEYFYDAASRLVKVETDLSNPAGPVYPVEYGYDAAGRTKWVSDENNPYDGKGAGLYPSVEYSYTPDGQIETEKTWIDLATNLSTTTRSTYDAFGDLDTVTVADGTVDAATTDYDYGELGRLDRITVASGTADAQVTEFVYDVDGNQVQRIQDPAGENLIWATGYDFWGRVECEADPLDTQVFAADGNLDCAAGSGTYSARYEYDDEGRTTKETRGTAATPANADSVTEFVYDTAGRLWKTQAEAGVHGQNAFGFNPYRYDVVEERLYTDAGRLEKTVTPPVDARWFNWSAGTGKITTLQAYDTAGRLKSTTSDSGGVDPLTTNYSYDAHGWLLTETSPEGRQSAFGYDAAGLITRVTRPANDTDVAIQDRTYTPTGQLATETDFYQAGVAPQPRRFTYNDDGTLAKAEDPIAVASSLANPVENFGNQVTYGYDLRGNRTSRTTSNSERVCTASCVTETWAFNDADLLTSRVVPRDDTSTATFTYGYDGVGRPRTVTEPIDATTDRVTTNYYVGHRLNRVDYAAGTGSYDVTFGYDDLDRRTSMTDLRGNLGDQVLFSYDEAGRLIKRDDQPTGDVTEWSWSVTGLPSRLRHPDGALMKFTHDTQRRQDTTQVVYLSVWVPLVDQAYDDDGLLDYEKLADDTLSFRDYTLDGAGNVTAYEQDFNGTDQYQRNMVWGYDGRLAVDYDTAGCSAYVYDGSGQLDTVADGTWNGTTGACESATVVDDYDYDNAGNRTKRTFDPGGGNVTLNYFANDANQITGIDTTGDATPETTYTYNDTGQRLSIDRPAGAADETYTYGPNGRLATHQSADGTTTADTTVVWDGDQQLAQIVTDDGTTTETTDIVWDQTRPVAEAIDVVKDGVRTRQNYGMKRVNSYTDWYSYDQFGNTIASTDYPNNPTDYSAYGEPEGPNLENFYFGYRGEITFGGDAVYLRARTYDPTIGQFLSRDRVDSVGGEPTAGNGYHYVGNDPVNFVDPSGLCRVSDVVFGWNGDGYDGAFSGPADGPDADKCQSGTGDFADVLCTTGGPLYPADAADTRSGDPLYGQSLICGPHVWRDFSDDVSGALATIGNEVWAQYRRARNFTASGLGLALADYSARRAAGVNLMLVSPVSPNCSGRSGYITECMVSHPFGGFQITFGNVVLNKDTDPMTNERLRHETKHADQWAIFGPGFGPLYLIAAGYDLAWAGPNGCKNVFEMWADLADGGYKNCS